MSSPPIPVSTGEGAFDPSVRWFQHAVFYEVLIRGYNDANNDGTGDLRGLREKLDYIEWLGIDCIWLLPFYPSPMRDGGYDISDFFNVSPDYGNIGDLVGFLEDAHRRGIRVIADLVMNHTSDEHPWFKESRSSRDNAKADWYVWNDDDQKWPDARVVFTDVERSNWTWDDNRQQYYWHRFYHHQPDLNYDNPEVADTMIDLVRFWFDLGFDGFRLGRRAVPLPARRHERRAPARDARVHQAHPQADRRRLPRPHPPGGGERLAERRGRLLRRRRRVPPLLPLPAHAAPLHGGAARAAVPDHRDPGADPGHRRRLPVGHLPAQPRRAHPRAGQRGGARLPDRGVRQGPADEAPHGHRPPARAAARQRPADGRAPVRADPLAAGEPRHLLRRRAADGRQHLSR